MASDFWIFVPDRVTQHFLVTHYMECKILHWDGRNVLGQHFLRAFTAIAYQGMLCIGASASARVAVNDDKAQGVYQLLCIARVFHNGLVVLFEVCPSATILPGKSSER